VSANYRGRPLSAVLFDLDGTLASTVGDIAAALNRALAEFTLAPIDEAEVRNLIGQGSPILMQRAAAARGRGGDEVLEASMLERFFHHYEEMEELGESTATAFPGAAESLGALQRAGVRTAVVTNKQRRFAAALLERLGLAPLIDAVIGGDSCERRKPDPQPLLFACESLGVPSSGALMVGDSINDVSAARAAGMPVICVSYGYNEGQDAGLLECDALLDSLLDLAPLLGAAPAR
jgi:phosphoglycolate phosphatase